MDKIDTMNYEKPPVASVCKIKDLKGGVVFSFECVGNSFNRTLREFLDRGNRDLQGLDFKAKDLQYIDFKNSDIDGADMRWANLNGADISKTLGKANLHQAKFSGITIWNTDCEYCEGTGILEDYDEEGCVISRKKCVCITGDSHSQEDMSGISGDR